MISDLLAPEEGALDPLKAEAIAARRARRTPWQNAHVDRLLREREARDTAKEYRRAQREAEALQGKQCKDCGEVKPAHAFELIRAGVVRGSCKDCRAEKRADQREARLAPIRAAKEAEREAERIATREAFLERRRKREERKRGIRKRTVSPEAQREAAERIDHLTSLLLGTNPDERIDSDQGWAMVTAELDRLWLQSGDKVCASCEAVVPPSAMRPPGPANFYGGNCRSCARTAWEASHRATYRPLMGPLKGPPRLRMRDGSFITVAEFARRVHERQNPPRDRSCLL